MTTYNALMPVVLLMSEPRPTYATAAAIRRGMATIEKIGSSVKRVIFRPDGSVEFVIGANDDEASEFDRLEAAGRL